MIEKRGTERFELALRAFIHCANEKHELNEMELTTKNISSGGAFLLAKRLSCRGTGLQADFFFPLRKLGLNYDHDSALRVSGNIVRTDENGLAICFDAGCLIIPAILAAKNYVRCL